MAFERLKSFLGRKKKGPKEGDTKDVPVHFQDETGKGEDRYHYEQHTFKDGKWQRTGTVMPVRQKNAERMHEYKKKKANMGKVSPEEAIKRAQAHSERIGRELHPPERNARHEIMDDITDRSSNLIIQHPGTNIDRRKEYDNKLAASSPDFKRDTDRANAQLKVSKNLRNKGNPGHDLARTFARYDAARADSSAEDALENMRRKRKKQGR